MQLSLLPFRAATAAFTRPEDFARPEDFEDALRRAGDADGDADADADADADSDADVDIDAGAPFICTSVKRTGPCHQMHTQVIPSGFPEQTYHAWISYFCNLFNQQLATIATCSILYWHRMASKKRWTEVI